jgi:hypothetical protein
MLTKQERNIFLQKVRKYVAVALHDLTKIQGKYTNREIAERCRLNATRISEIFSTRNVPLNEITLRKLIGGGFVRYKDIMKKVDLTPEEKDYLRRFAPYEDGEYIREVEELSDMGCNAAVLLRKLKTLSKMGVDVDVALDSLIKSAKI